MKDSFVSRGKEKANTNLMVIWYWEWWGLNVMLMWFWEDKKSKYMDEDLKGYEQGDGVKHTLIYSFFSNFFLLWKWQTYFYI